MAVIVDISDGSKEKITEKISGIGKEFRKEPDLVIVYPTETCYGLGCRLSSKKGTERIYKIKGRNLNKKMLVIVSDRRMAERFFELNETARKLMKEFMPGALSLIVKEKDKEGEEKKGESIAFRISGNEIARKISEIAQEPVFATSANQSGEKEIYSGKKVVEEFSDKVDVVINRGELEENKPSTVYDAINKKIVREGEVSLKEIEVCLNDCSGD